MEEEEILTIEYQFTTPFLIAKGNKVICLDNLITGKTENISHLMDNPNFRFVRHDVTTHIDIDAPVDFVLHFASPASPIDYLMHPIPTLKVGSLGTHNTLGVAKAKKAKYLLASTSEVYGDPKVNPQPESYYGNVNCVGPRGVYDEAKRFAEAITMAYHKAHGLDTAIVRIFNTYGPRMRKNDGRVIPNFITQALKNEPITVYGKGDQTRSLCFVSDLIEGIFLLSQSDIHDPVNIGNPHELKIIDLAELIIKLTNSKAKIIFNPLPEDDPKLRQPDITRARKFLNWEPKVELEKGLKETIKWFMKKLLGTVIPFLITHLICCGTLLFFLISSGYLLTLANEGRNRLLLLPSLILFVGGIWLLHRHNRNCCRKTKKTLADWIFTFLLYGAIYFIFSWSFIVYIFIPWWIPDYQGGILLP